jgi:hypothetical protein
MGSVPAWAGNIKKSSDIFEITSEIGRGTRVKSTIMLNGK